jgi:hypothetical protein
MSEDHVRSAYEIKRKLLRRAIREGRGPEMIMMIQWRLSYIKHVSEEDKDIIKECSLMEDDQPRAVRMLNALARLEGEDVRFSLIPDGTSIH